MSKHPNILIISNNAISDTDNNGKTLNYIFSNYPSSNIRQIYFKPSKPTGKNIDSFFRITDREMFDVFFRKKSTAGFSHDNIIDAKSNNGTNKRLPVNNLTRIAREIVWRGSKWKSKNLSNWLDEFLPDIIFFVAGDSGFSYDITLSIKNKYNTKLITYITDDYILPRKTLNFLWWMRRNLLFNKMKKAISCSNLLLTISPKMRKTYYNIFNKDSIVVSNMTNSLAETSTDSTKSQYNKLIYAGGLHYNRYKVLIKLGQSIKEINEYAGCSKKSKLFIYTNQKPKKAILDKINIPGACHYGGSLNKLELIRELNDSDILVHVESFDRRSIESTRLSLSTKIGEYLSLGKPILAIGPEDIGSMEYLKDSAYCINQETEIKNSLQTLLSDEELRANIAKKAKNKYKTILSNEDNYKIENMIKKIRI